MILKIKSGSIYGGGNMKKIISKFLNFINNDRHV